MSGLNIKRHIKPKKEEANSHIIKLYNELFNRNTGACKEEISDIKHTFMTQLTTRDKRLVELEKMLKA